MKNGCQRVIQNHSKSMYLAPSGPIFVILVVSGGGWNFNVFPLAKKGANKPPKYFFGAIKARKVPFLPVYGEFFLRAGGRGGDKPP